MDQLVSMSVFVRVADAKSFAAAAAQLNISPTMAANHIRALEARLGARLIDRTTRRHELTDIGSAYLERCREVLLEVAASDQVADAFRSRPTGRLRVTASVAWGSSRLAPIIAGYCRAFPDVQIELELLDRLVDLEEEGFHVAVRSGASPNPRLAARPLPASPMIVAASPAYLAAAGPLSRPEDLSGHNLLAFSVWGPDPVWRFTRDGRTVLIPVKGSLTTNSGEVLVQAAIADLGVVVQQAALLERPIARGELVRLLDDWTLAGRPLQIVWPKRLAPSAKLHGFIDYVADQLRDAGAG